MSKKYIFIVLILLILLGVVVWYWQFKKVDLEQPAETSTQENTPAVSTNPLENKPNINPVDQTNPFINIKTNPFE